LYGFRLVLIGSAYSSPGNALDGPATNAKLLGKLVNSWAPRNSQSLPDALFQLGIDERATASAFPSAFGIRLLGPKSAKHFAMPGGRHVFKAEVFRAA
jgi:hypothetical protein